MIDNHILLSTYTHSSWLKVVSLQITLTPQLFARLAQSRSRLESSRTSNLHASNSAIKPKSQAVEVSLQINKTSPLLGPCFIEIAQHVTIFLLHAFIASHFLADQFFPR